MPGCGRRMIGCRTSLREQHDSVLLVELLPDGLEPDGLPVARVGSVPYEPVESPGGLAREQRGSETDDSAEVPDGQAAGSGRCSGRFEMAGLCWV